MKKIIFSMALFSCLPAVCYAKATSCPLFPLLDALVTPLPVGDDASFAMASSLRQFQKQIVDKAKEYRESMEKYRDKLGTELSSSGDASFKLPEIKSVENGAGTGIDVFAGNADPEGQKGSVVDLTKPDSIQKALDDFVLVSNTATVAEEQMADQVKRRYLQQSAAETMAKVLYYKHELNELIKMEEDIANASADETTAGVISLANRVAELKNRVKVLQQKVTSLILELETGSFLYTQEFLSTKIQE